MPVLGTAHWLFVYTLGPSPPTLVTVDKPCDFHLLTQWHEEMKGMINFNFPAKQKNTSLGLDHQQFWGKGVRAPKNIYIYIWIEETIIGLEPSEGFQTSGKKTACGHGPAWLQSTWGFLCFLSWLNMAIGMAIGMAEKALNTAVVVINLDSTCCCGQRLESCKQQRSFHGKPTINYRWYVFRKLCLVLFALFMFPLLGEMIQVDEYIEHTIYLSVKWVLFNHQLQINPSGAMLFQSSLNRFAPRSKPRLPRWGSREMENFCLLFALASGIVKQLFACKTCKFIVLFGEYWKYLYPQNHCSAWCSYYWCFRNPGFTSWGW